MLPFTSPEKTESITVGGKTYQLRPLRDEAGIDWVQATVEDGRQLAAALGDKHITKKTIRRLIMRGIERCAMALGCSLDEAAAFTEDERRFVIETQDRLQQTNLIEPYLNIEQAAARSYLKMGTPPA